MATSIFRKNFPQVDILIEKAEQAQYIIGLDLHKKTTAITVIDTKKPLQPIFQRKRLKNIKLPETIKQFQGNKVVIVESSYGWFPAREAFNSFKDITFIIFDARKTSGRIDTIGIKSDKIDAEVLAYACLKGGIPALAVHQPSCEMRENFKLVNTREQLVRQQTRIKNQIKALDRDYGVNPYTGEIPDKTDTIKKMELFSIEKYRKKREKQFQNSKSDIKNNIEFRSEKRLLTSSNCLV